MNTVANKNPIPTTLYTQNDVIYAHVGGDFMVLAVAGKNGRAVQTNAAYPKGLFPSQDASWASNHTAIAQHIALAVNSYPVLRKRVARHEAREADLVAKLKLAKAALQRGATVDPAFVASLVREIDLTLNAAGGRDQVVPVKGA